MADFVALIDYYLSEISLEYLSRNAKKSTGMLKMISNTRLFTRYTAKRVVDGIGAN